MENVQTELDKFGIRFPIVLDNDYGTWNAYQNSYWPRKYIIDLNGNIIYDHIGEGNYEETESLIRELLLERTRLLGLSTTLPNEDDQKINTVEKIQPVTLMTDTLSPETYLGSDRSQNQYNGTDKAIPLYKYALSKNWGIESEYIASKTRSESLSLHFAAAKVYLVGESDIATQARILIDGKPISQDRMGADVKNGLVTFSKSRLYELFASPTLENHTITIAPAGAGVNLYAFTFGE